MAGTAVNEKRGDAQVSFEANPLIESMLVGNLPDDCSAIEKDMLREVLRARRNATPISILVLSVDGAKAQNALRTMMRKLLVGVGETVRHTDACGFLTSSEILIVLPGSPAPGAEIAGNRVAANGHLRRLAASGISVSLGLAELQGDETTLTTLIERARAFEDKIEPRPLKKR